MPFTYFAHQLFVLPFKLVRPRWFDGTALCIGSMAPDFAYAFEHLPFAFGSHTSVAQLTWTLPMSLAGVLWVRRFVALPLAEQLPQPLSGEVQALAHSRHSLAVSGASAVLGGLSHVFVDGFTHYHGWAAERWSSLRTELFEDWSIARVLQYTGHTFGTLIGFLLFAWLVRERRLSAWRGELVPSRSYRRERWFWPAVTAGSLLAIPTAFSVLLTGGGPPAAIMRASWLLLAVLGIATLLVRRREPEAAAEPQL